MSFANVPSPLCYYCRHFDIEQFVSYDYFEELELYLKERYHWKADVNEFIQRVEHRYLLYQFLPPKHRCKAFPGGIPSNILKTIKGTDHRKTYPGDNGVLFEVLTGMELVERWRIIAQYYKDPHLEGDILSIQKWLQAYLAELDSGRYDDFDPDAAMAEARGRPTA